MALAFVGLGCFYIRLFLFESSGLGYTLSVNFSYAEYARQGFFERCAVLVFNGNWPTACARSQSAGKAPRPMRCGLRTTRAQTPKPGQAHENFWTIMRVIGHSSQPSQPSAYRAHEALIERAEGRN